MRIIVTVWKLWELVGTISRTTYYFWFAALLPYVVLYYIVQRHIYGLQLKIHLKNKSKNWNPTYCSGWFILYFSITRHAGTLLSEKNGFTSNPIFLSLCIYDIPKWTTIRSKCDFKLLHAYTRWIHAQCRYTYRYHNNGFFLRKKTNLPPNKRTQQE